MLDAAAEVAKIGFIPDLPVINLAGIAFDRSAGKRAVSLDSFRRAHIVEGRIVCQIGEQKQAMEVACFHQLIIREPVVLALGFFDAPPGKVLPAPFDACLLHGLEPGLEVRRIRVKGSVNAKRRIGPQTGRRISGRKRHGEAVGGRLEPGCGSRAGRRCSKREAQRKLCGFPRPGATVIFFASAAGVGKVKHMRSRISAGLALYRIRDGQLEVFLAHPGGPLFAHRDEGHWTIPKGEIEPDEDYLKTAVREFKEEIGFEIPLQSRFIELGSIRQKGGKIVHAWAVETNCKDPIVCKSNFFKMEWPMGSGKWQEFPEVDRAQFFPVAEAKRRIKETQVPLLERLEAALKL